MNRKREKKIIILFSKKERICFCNFFGSFSSNCFLFSAILVQFSFFFLLFFRLHAQSNSSCLSCSFSLSLSLFLFHSFFLSFSLSFSFFLSFFLSLSLPHHPTFVCPKKRFFAGYPDRLLRTHCQSGKEEEQHPKLRPF